MPLPVPNFSVPGLMEIRSPKMADSEARWYLSLRAYSGEEFVQDVVIVDKDGNIVDLTGYSFEARLWQGGKDDPLTDVFEEPIAAVNSGEVLGLAYEGDELRFTTEEGQTLNLKINTTSWRVRLRVSAERLKKLDQGFWKWELYATHASHPNYRIQGYFYRDRRAFDMPPA